MIAITELVGPEVIQDLATPANVQLGQALAARNEVELTTTSSGSVEGRVGGGHSRTQRRRVALWPGQQALAWSCTCTNDPIYFASTWSPPSPSLAAQRNRRLTSSRNDRQPVRPLEGGPAGEREV